MVSPVRRAFFRLQFEMTGKTLKIKNNTTAGIDRY